MYKIILILIILMKDVSYVLYTVFFNIIKKQTRFIKLRSHNFITYNPHSYFVTA